MNSDFKELLQIFNDHRVEYMVVGGYAAIHYSQPRYTKDLDLWIRPSIDNATRVAKVAFDFLTTIKGLDFDTAWENREKSDEEGFSIWYVGKNDLITAKRAVGREQDLHDIDEINRADS